MQGEAGGGLRLGRPVGQYGTKGLHADVDAGVEYPMQACAIQSSA